MRLHTVVLYLAKGIVIYLKGLVINLEVYMFFYESRRGAFV